MGRVVKLVGKDIEIGNFMSNEEFRVAFKMD